MRAFPGFTTMQSLESTHDPFESLELAACPSHGDKASAPQSLVAVSSSFVPDDAHVCSGSLTNVHSFTPDGEYDDIVSLMHRQRGQRSFTASHEDQVIEVDMPAPSHDLIRILHRWQSSYMVDTATFASHAVFLTWFVNPVIMPVCATPHAVVLGENIITWEEQLLEPWMSQVNTQQSYRIQIVGNEMLQRWYPNIAGHVLVSQTPDDHLTPVLVLNLREAAGRQHCRLVASFYRDLGTFDDFAQIVCSLQRIVGLPVLMPIEMRHADGPPMLPDSDHLLAPFPHDGVVQISSIEAPALPSSYSEDATGTASIAEVPQGTPQHRDSDEAEADDEPSSMMQSSSSWNSQPSPVVLHQRGRTWIHSQVRIQHPQHRHADVARALHVPLHHVRQLHEVRTQLIGHDHGRAPWIAELLGDIQDPLTECLLLVDVAMYPSGPSHLQPVPSVVRKVRRSRRTLTRQDAFELARVASYCESVHHACFIRHNGLPWRLLDLEPHFMHPGDYLEFHFPPQQDASLEDTCQSIVQMEEDRPDQHEEGELDDASDAVSAWTPSTERHEVALEHEIEITFCVWAIAHNTFARCARPRTIISRGDSINWFADILSAWPEVLQPLQPTAIHVIFPQPETQDLPGGRTCIHVVAEQDFGPARLAVLLTVDDRTGQYPAERVFAASMPTAPALDDFRRTLRLPSQMALPLRVQVYLHRRLQSGSQPIQCPSGANLVICLDHTPSNATHDDYSFLHLSHQANRDHMIVAHHLDSVLDSRALPWLSAFAYFASDACHSWLPLQRSPHQHGISIGDQDARGEATAWQPARAGHIRHRETFDASLTIHDLVAWWTTQGTRTEQTNRQGPSFLSYFISGTTHPVCDTPRPFRPGRILDPLQWSDLVAAVWADIFDPSTQLHVFVIDPQPPDDLDSEYIHILFLQHPVPGAVPAHMSLKHGPAQPWQWSAYHMRQFANQFAIITMLDLAPRCFLPQRSVCSVWHKDTLMRNSEDRQVSHADGFRVIVEDLPHPMHSAASVVPNVDLESQQQLDRAGHYASVFAADGFIPMHTWFIHHRSAPTCHRSRLATLQQDPSTWIGTLCQLWAEICDPMLSICIRIVEPQPSRIFDAPRTVHIMLSQTEPDFEDRSAVLFAILHDFRATHVARSVPHSLSKEHIAVYTQLSRVCRQDHEIFDCIVKWGSVLCEWQHLLQVPDGAWITIEVIPRPESLRHNRSMSEEQDEPDVTSSFQHASVIAVPAQTQDPLVSLNPWTQAPDTYAAASSDLSSLQGSETSYTCNLWNVWSTSIDHLPFNIVQTVQLARSAGQTLAEDSIPTWTWFLHPDRLPECRQPRLVFYQNDIGRWLREVVRLWQDHVNVNRPIEAFVVFPQPLVSHNPHAHGLHVLVLQDRSELNCGVLVSQLDGAEFTVFATFMPAMLRKADFFRVIHLHDRCYADPIVVTCDASHLGLMLSDQMPSLLQNGHGMLVNVQPVPTVASPSGAHPDTGPSDTGGTNMTIESNTTGHAPEPPVVDAPAGTGNQAPGLHNSAMLDPTPETTDISSYVQLPLRDTHELPPSTREAAEETWISFEHDLHSRCWTHLDVHTWYISHTSHTVCDNFRRIQLVHAVNTWQEQIENIWADRLDSTQPTFIQWVNPVFRCPSFAGVHLILWQHPVPSRIVGLAVATAEPFEPAAVHFRAHSAPILCTSGSWLIFQLGPARNSGFGHCGSDHPDAFSAELIAVAQALCWLITSPDYQTNIPATIWIDSQAAMFCANGQWTSRTRSFVSTALRPLWLAASTLGTLDSQWTPSHSHNPFNDMADHLAKSAARLLVPSGPSLSCLSHHRTALPWLWMLWDSQLNATGPSFDEDTMQIPDVGTITGTDQAILPQAQECTVDTINLQLKMSTYNVGTLYGWGQCRRKSPAWKPRKELLVRQFTDHHVLALQETRGRTTGIWTEGDIIGVSSAADKGQGGCDLWLRRLMLPKFALEFAFVPGPP
eukprot:Skav210497  [mRNA]  locus=scaffold601:255026:262483:+ [translate_table: standard]